MKKHDALLENYSVRIRQVILGILVLLSFLQFSIANSS